MKSVWESVLQRRISGVDERIGVLRGTPEPQLPYGVFAVCVDADEDGIAQALCDALREPYETYINRLDDPNDAYSDPNGFHPGSYVAGVVKNQTDAGSEYVLVITQLFVAPDPDPNSHRLVPVFEHTSLEFL